MGFSARRVLTAETLRGCVFKFLRRARSGEGQDYVHERIDEGKVLKVKARNFELDALVVLVFQPGVWEVQRLRVKKHQPPQGLLHVTWTYFAHSWVLGDRDTRTTSRLCPSIPFAKTVSTWPNVAGTCKRGSRYWDGWMTTHRFPSCRSTPSSSLAELTFGSPYAVRPV